MNKSILIVEDNILLSEMYTYKLRLEWYDVHLSSDGEKAVKFLFEWSMLPDLILLDIMMPKMDGFEVLRRIRLDPRFGDTKIIVFSNLNEQRDRERCFRLGADDFLLKANVTPKDLIEHIRNLLEQYD